MDLFFIVVSASKTIERLTSRFRRREQILPALPGLFPASDLERYAVSEQRDFPPQMAPTYLEMYDSLCFAKSPVSKGVLSAY